MDSRPYSLLLAGLVLIMALIACRSLSLSPTPPQDALQPTITPGLPLAGTRLTDLTPSPTVSQPTDIHPTPSGPNPSHPAEPTPAGLVLPPGVPLYPGAFYFFYAGAMVSFASDDPPAMVMKFYEEKLPAGGWTFVNDDSDPDTISQNWQRGNQRLNVMILFNKSYYEDIGCYISLTWPRK